ncbi:PhaM family polyhydroxyalkanoate granule multifunctional regulatory protein [Inhella gelatinilytica]|uniref:Uncharacterized protein n=1 Tax=Inhella gelatinilytica TaxID=2795030 RepID=A0A931N9R8_9BURK|nr:PhaM family polyhydroxyalkanoate granule multifunctional regulatory protein [Inhella gelatinilytica]MBH9551658.1 hypothetical protein [Inhella gelatinilytica]
MSDANFSKFVPGFEFLQGLVKNAGTALPGIGQWVAPTLNPEELGKRIEELRTVQFWLEQNARMLAATIQALEVQRMTLSTLKTMNVPLQELKEVLKVPTPMVDGLPGMPGLPGVPPGLKPAKPRRAAKPAAAAATPEKPAVDPMQWWSALSQQFSQVAAQAMKDSATEAAKGLATSLVKHSIDAAGDTLRKAASVPQAVMGGVTGSMAKSLSAQRAAAESAGSASAGPDDRAPVKRKAAAKPPTKPATKTPARPAPKRVRKA